MPTLNEACIYTKANGLRPPWAIFPLRGKCPAISKDKGGHGCLDATTNIETIKKWWTEYPNANIGLATGSVNGILVIDVDRNHENDVDGNDTLRVLEDKLGKLPDSVEAQTPNKGRHLFFKYPAGYDIGIHKSENGDAWPGIDIRGNGGYVAAVPSEIRCNDGHYRQYQWEVGSYPNETELAELPAPWLKWVDDICGRHQGFTLPAPASVTPGRRNDTLFTYACHLRAGGADAEAIRAKLAEFNARIPAPLGDKELDAITSSAMRYNPNTTTMPAAEAAEARKSKPRMTRAILADTMHALDVSVRYNLISCSYEIQGRTPAGRAMGQDDLYALLHDTMAGEYKGVGFDSIAAYATFEAREHSYNPVLELLKNTPWDEKKRMPQLFAIMGIEGDALSMAMTEKWLLQTVALLFNDAAQPYGADGCLVLNGEQGTGKTSLFRHLALKDEWFGEGCSIDDRDKDTTRRIVTKWISELGEVESTLKSDISKLKAFITSPMDSYRLPYAQADTVAPRHTSLCATCNSDRYLIDTTGNRRWWSVPFMRTVPRKELLALDALQLWAEVFAIVEPMTPEQRAACYRLTGEEQNALEERNGAYEKPSKGQDEVADILDKAEREQWPEKPMSISEFKALHDVLRAYSVNQIGVALRRCGVVITHTKRGSVANLPYRFIT